MHEHILRQIEHNKKLREDGKMIAIPFPFKRFQEHVPGIQQRRYIITTASLKVGKTKFTDFIFMYHVLDWLEANPGTNINVKIFYFSLEMSQADKWHEAIAYRLWTKHNIICTPDMQLSLFEKRIMSDDMVRLIRSEEPWYDFVNDHVEFVDKTRNPFGIYKHVRKYMHDHGKYVLDDGSVIPGTAMDKPTDALLERKPVYVPDNPDEFVIVITDHVSLLTPEKGKGLHASMSKFSSDYCLRLRDRYGCIIVNVQQQSASKEDLSHRKAEMLRPTAQGLGDNKLTGRDCDMMLGLFSPARHDITSWNNYDISTLGNYYRELSVIMARRGPSVTTDLFMNAPCNHFRQLPRATDRTNMNKVVKTIQRIEKETTFT